MGSVHNQNSAYIGKRFGNQTVLAFAGYDSFYRPKYLLKCDCGNEQVRLLGSIKSRKNCGEGECIKLKVINLLGKMIGRLIVVSFAGYVQEKKQRLAAWNCLCSCGKMVVVKAQNLQSALARQEGKHAANAGTRSCGCLLKDVQKDFKNRSKTTSHGGSKTLLYKSWIKMRSNAQNLWLNKEKGIFLKDVLPWNCDDFSSFREAVGASFNEASKRDNNGIPSLRILSEVLEAQRKLYKTQSTPIPLKVSDFCWAINAEKRRWQSSRKYRINGTDMTILEIAKIAGVSRQQIWNRIRANWKAEDLTLQKNESWDRKRVKANPE